MKPIVIFASIFITLTPAGCSSSRMQHEEQRTLTLDKLSLSLKIADTLFSISAQPLQNLSEIRFGPINNQSKLDSGIPNNMGDLPTMLNSIPRPILVRRITLDGQITDSLSNNTSKQVAVATKKNSSTYTPLPGLIISCVLLLLMGMLLSKFFPGSK